MTPFCPIDTLRMSTDWQSTLVQRLANGAADCGGFGYRHHQSLFTEPTCMACLALQSYSMESQKVNAALQWLAQLQRADGSVPVAPGVRSPCWTTSLAILAWLSLSDGTVNPFSDAVQRAVDWLIATHGLTFDSDPRIYGHDTKIVGWPWVEDTHSWIEPTAYAILALKAAGHGDHPRVREGVRVLQNRAIKDGGWNYGNCRMFSNDLRPFPATTGIALAAVADERDTGLLQHASDFLRKELPQTRAPLSLGWGVIGLTACGTRPLEASRWLAQSAARMISTDPSPLEEAVLVLADRQPCTLVHFPSTKLMAHTP